MGTYAAQQAIISQAQPVAFSGGSNLLHGETSGFALSAPCDFSVTGIPATGYGIDMSQFQNRMQLKVVQTIFIDNSLNNGYVDVKNPQFAQSFALPAGYQGYFPILASKLSGNKFNVTSTGTGLCNVILLNVLMPMAIWAATVTPPSTGAPQAVSDAILDACVTGNRMAVSIVAAAATAADASGTITAGGTSQILLAANTNRQGFLIQNIDSAYPAEGLWICPSGAAVIGGSGSFGIAASASAGYPGGALQFPWSNQITIIGATTGHKFSCVQW